MTGMSLLCSLPLNIRYSHRYEFVGQNTIETKENRGQLVDIPVAERIRVQNNDMIGIYYEYSKGEIPYDTCSDSNVVVTSSQTSYSSPTSFAVGDIVDFETDGSCKMFSLTAIIGPVRD